MEEESVSSHILYELLVYKEWEFERVKKKPLTKNSLIGNGNKPHSWWRNNKIPWPEEDLAKAGALMLPWHISVSPDGKRVALLQDSVLEIRQASDEYMTTIGRGAVPKDRRPQHRKLAWSPDSTLIAVASSDASVRIFDFIGSLIYKIPLLMPEDPPIKLITGLEFLASRKEKDDWELLVVYSNGTLDCYNISHFDKCCLDHSTVLSQSGISCTAFSSHYNILFVSVKPLTLLAFESKQFSPGMTAWRLLNEAPYYEKIFPTDDELSILPLHGKVWHFFSFISPSDCLCKIMISPSNEYIATLNTAGVLFIWLAPSLRLHSSIHELDCKKQKVLVPLSDAGINTHVIDVEWRKDNKLIVAWKNGTISIHDINSSVVLTYFGPDLMHSLPRLAPAPSLHGFLALECERENFPLSSSNMICDTNDSSSNESKSRLEDSSSDDSKSILGTTTKLFYSTMYLITDLERYEPKNKSVLFEKQTFRLLGVKMTTPQELFERCLITEDFEKAIQLCEEYGLDLMKVYKREWRTSEVTEYSVNEFLANISDEDWVLTECLERIPGSLSGAKILLEFGLNYTNIKATIDAHKESSKNFTVTDKQQRIINARLKLLDYAEKLSIYEQIVNEYTYDMKYYQKFRNQSLANSAIDFARFSQTDAIILLMTSYGNEVLPFWLDILDNYPESCRPQKYSRILPECDGDYIPVRWKCFEVEKKVDWAQLEYDSEYKAQLNSQPGTNFDESAIYDPDSLREWYKKRALAIEKYSTMVDNAVELLELGTSRNIKGLDEMLFEFKMLSVLIYELNVTISYSTFHNHSTLEKLQFYIQKSDDFSDAMLKWIHPYLEHYAALGSVEWLNLYSEFMINNSKTLLGPVIKYFSNILNGQLSLVGTPKVLVNVIVACIYSYQNVDILEDAEYLINDAIEWFCTLSQEMGEDILLKELYALKDEVRSTIILVKNKYEKPVSFVHDIKTDFDRCKQFIFDFVHSTVKMFDTHVEEWEVFLLDLIALRQHCFSLIPLEYFYEVYGTHLLTFGSISLIEYSPKHLCCSQKISRKHLTFDLTVKIITDAARYYFNSSSACDDEFMLLAKTCLLLIKEDNELIQRELDLISVVIFLSQMGVNILPLQVRQTEDKMKLIEMCLDRNPTAYSKPQLIYSLALKLYGTDTLLEDYRTNVTLRLAHESYRRCDYEACADFCNELILDQNADGWKICINLAECTGYKDINMKIKCVAFASLYAPTRMLPQIVDIRSELENKQILANIHDLLNNYFSQPIWQSLQCDDKLKCLKQSSTTQDFIVSFYKLWKDGFFQEHITNLLGKDFFIAYPYIYSSLFPEPCTFNKYYDSNLYSTKEILFDLFNSLLRFIILEWKSAFDETIFSEVMVACSIVSASKDSALSLCYLLCLKNPEESTSFFNYFNKSSLLFKMNLYYLALKSVCYTTKNKLQSTPHQVLSLFISIKDNKLENLFKDILQSFKKFNEASQVKDCGVDYNRFIEDETYKSDTIFGLAMNDDCDKLKLAVKLGYQNGIPAHEVIMSHLVFLLLGCSYSIINDRLTDTDIIEELSENKAICLERLMSALPNLNGSNCQQLICFFSVVKILQEDYILWDLTPKEHISLLKKIKSLSKDFNYKSLVLHEEELHTTLKNVMSIDNIFVVNKFIKCLPYAIKSKYQIGMFFCHWAIEEFFKQCSNCSFKQCVLNFESLHKFFSKFSTDELKYFINETILAEKCVSIMDSGVRKQLITSLMNWCKSNGPSSAYEKILVYLKHNLDLLNSLWDEELEFSSNELKTYIFLIEDCLRKNCKEQKTKDVLIKATMNLSLKTSDLLYLHKISNIKEPLMDIINTIYMNSTDSHFAEEWKRRFDLNCEDFVYHEMILHKSQITNEEELIQYYLGVMMKLYASDLDETNFQVDLKNNSCLSTFLHKLLSNAKTFDQLVILHRFMVDVPNAMSYDIEKSILIILAEIIESEYKYSLAEDILKKNDLRPQDFTAFIDNLQSCENSKQKLFMCWICFHSGSIAVQKAARCFFEFEGDLFCKDFFHLPKVAVMKIVPHIIDTTFCQKLIKMLVKAEKKETSQYFIETLKNSSLDIEAAMLSLSLVQDTPKGMRSFDTVLHI